MSTFSSLVDCPNLQIALNEAFMRPGNITDRSTLLEFLLSEVSRQGLSQRITPGNGKVRNVEVRYSQRYLESEVDENVANPKCSAGDPYTDLISTYSIDTDANVGMSTTFQIKDLERTCRENPEIFMDMLAKLVNVVERKTATKTANKVVSSLIGNWASDTLNADGTAVSPATTLEVATLASTASGLVDPSLYSLVQIARQVSGFDAGVAFTGQKLYRYGLNAQTGCCVVDQGIDLRAQLDRFGTVFSWDRRVETAMSTNFDGIFVAPGALALVWYMRSEWKNGVPMVEEGSNYLFMPIQGPTGLPMDLTVKDDCGTITLSVIATTDVFGMPDDIFKSGDVYEGITGVAGLKIVNPS